MKVLCNKNELLQGINHVSKAVSSKTTMDILQCILVEAFNNKIRLTANDTELGIETIIDGDIIEPGKIALEAKLFSEIIKRDRSNVLQVRIHDIGEGEELSLWFRKIKGGNNSLDHLLDSVRVKCSPLKLPDEEIFKKITISKKVSGIIVIIDKNEDKRVEKTLSKNGDYYRVTQNVELSMVKLK